MNTLTRPFRPIDLSQGGFEPFELHDLATQLRQEPQYEDEGKAGVALARDPHVSVILQTLRKGSELREHRAPSSALVTLLSGRATFVSEPGGKRTPMGPGTLVAFGAEVDHALLAEEDCTCLIVIGGRTART